MPGTIPKNEVRVSRRSKWDRGGSATGGDAAKTPSLKPLAGLVSHLSAHRGMLIVAGVALVISALVLLAVPLAVRRMIDFGFAGHDNGTIDRYFLGLIGLGAALAVASAARFYAVNWLGERVVADLRAKVFAHLAKLDASYFERQRSGEIMSRITADTTQITAAAGAAFSQVVRDAIMLLGALVMMVATSPRLSGLVLVAIPAIVLPLVAYGRSVRRLSRSAQDTLADAAGYAAEHLAAHRTMQSATAEGVVTGRYRTAIETAFGAARSRFLARAGLTALVILLVFAGIVGVMWHGAGLVISGAMTAGALSQFVLYAVFAGSSLAGLSEVWGATQQAAGAAERLTEILAIEPGIASPASPVPLPDPPDGRIAFENVSFRYEQEFTPPALERVTFDVAPGETVAIVGPSGAGKSTILALALRFFDPSEGRVLLDGVALPDADLTAVRQRIALVPQDVALFADTVAENIRYGKPAASRAEIEQAAAAAHADAFIRALPKGYETVLGERGVTLSGGQRQRIAIARAVLRDAPILLLDEATSALDAESEVAVQKALDTLRRGHTTLIVAHRLSTVLRADRILVMDDGRIIEEGKHQELVARGGLYARLAELQLSVPQAAAQ
ncbi:MAG: ABC transporter transmembrane domain-containing protein [Hyphomicrobiaceae bacterium]